jgi:hypothetical protein
MSKKQAWGLALLVLAGCGDEEQMTLPTPPDLTGLEQEYAAPTGTVAPDEVACLAQQAQKRLDDDELPFVRQLMTDALDALRRRIDASGLPTDPAEPIDSSDARLRGVVTVERICRGWDSSVTTPDPATNGTIVLNALYADGLKPVIWGQATGCRGPVAIGPAPFANIYLDATLEFYLYRGLRAGGDTSFLLKLNGEVGTDQSRHAVDWDFRWSTASLDVRVPSRDGEVIAAVDEQGRVELHGRDGMVSVYDPATMTCTTQSVTGSP